MVIDMESNHKPRILYEYENERLEFASIYNDSIVCVSQEDNNNAGKLISVEGDTRNILFELPFNMMYPQIIDENNIIYLAYQNDDLYLGKFEISKQSSEVLINDIDYFMPSIQDRNNILVTKLENEALSPDNKYIAYYHGSLYSWPYAVKLRIMSLEDGRSMDIDYKWMQPEVGFIWIK